MSSIDFAGVHVVLAGCSSGRPLTAVTHAGGAKWWWMSTRWGRAGCAIRRIGPGTVASPSAPRMPPIAVRLSSVRMTEAVLLALVDHDLALPEHDLRLQHLVDVLRGVAIQQDYVGDLAHLERADLIGHPHVAGGVGADDAVDVGHREHDAE